MDTTGLHIRSAIRLDATYVKGLPVAAVQPSGPNQRRTLTFVADVVTFAGATFSDIDVVVVAREVTGTRIRLENSSIAASAEATGGQPAGGAPGFALTVLCSRLSAQGATTAGGTGGKGTVGAQGDPHPPAPQPPPNEPVVKPGPSEQGNPGKRGGKGGPGGPGGPLSVMCEQVVGGGSWESAGGPGGSGGDGGPGGPASSGTGPHVPGPQGPQGVTGDVPASTFVNPTVVGHPALVQTLKDRGVNGRLADSLARTARFRSGLDALELAADRRTYSRELGFGDIHLDYRITMDATPLPVERDIELVPDVPTYVQRSKLWRERLAAAVVAPGIGAGPADLDEVAGRLAELLADMQKGGGTLPTIASEALQRKEAAAEIKSDADLTITRLRVQILEEFPAVSFTAGGRTFTGSEFQQRVAFDLAGQTALPTAPDLIVSKPLRNSGTGYASQRLAALRADAMGLAGPQNTGPAGWVSAMTTRAVDLSKVRGELQAARNGTPAGSVLRARYGVLVELLDAVQASLLASLRVEQADFTLATESLRTAAAEAARQSLSQLAVPATPAPPIHAARQGDLIAGAATVMDLLGYHLAQERQAIRLFTVGTSPLAGIGNPFDPTPDPDGPPPGPVLDPDKFAGLVADPDRPPDAREVGIDPTPPARVVMPAVAAKDNTGVVEEYLGRGIGLGITSDGVTDPPSHQVEFGPGSPELIQLAQKKPLWFDVPLADLAGPLGSGPHREVKVLGARVRLDGVTAVIEDDPVPPLSVKLVHSGTSEQRVLGAGGHRLVQLPARIDLKLTHDPQAGPGVCHGATLVGDTETEQTFVTTVLPLTFPPYARGVAAGWTLEVTGGDISLDALTAIRINLVYGTVLPTGVASLAAVTMDRGDLQVGSRADVTVRLTAPAPAGGFRVDLSADDAAAVKLPPSVLLAAGSVTATFSITAVKPVTAVRITARGQDGMARRGTIAVRDAAEATSVQAGGGKDTVSVLARVPGAGTGPAVIYAGLSLPRPAESQPADHGTLVGYTPGLVETRRIDVGSEPRAVVHDPVRNALVVLAGQAVTVFDATTLAVRMQREVGFTATDVAVDAAAGLVLVPQLGPGRVLVLSAVDLSDRPTIDGVPAAFRVAHASGTDRAYVAQSAKAGPTGTPVAGLTLLRRRPQGYIKVASVTIEPGLILPQEVLADPVLNRVYVPCQGNIGAGPPSLRVYSGALKLLRDIPLAGPARAVAGVPGSGTITVATDRGAIQVDTFTGAVGDMAELPNRVPNTVAVDPLSGVAYVGDRLNGTVTMLPISLAPPPTHWS